MPSLGAGLCIDGPEAWTQAKASGKSPADLAMFMGHESTHKRVFEQLRATLAASMAGVPSAHVTHAAMCLALPGSQKPLLHGICTFWLEES